MCIARINFSRAGVADCKQLSSGNCLEMELSSFWISFPGGFSTGGQKNKLFQLISWLISWFTGSCACMIEGSRFFSKRIVIYLLSVGGKQHGPRNHLHRRISKSWVLLLLTCLAALAKTLPLPLLILPKFSFPCPGALRVFLSVQEPRHTEVPLQLGVIQAHGHISEEISGLCHLGTIWSILLSTLSWILPQTLSTDKISLCFFSF